MYRLASDRKRAALFLEELLPKLAAWHEYLYRERARVDGGLVEIWHPWESGMDNSPLWDSALERVTFDAERLPRYDRVDVEVAEATERPSDGEYDRYVYLVTVFRELDYDSSRIGHVVPFALQPVLFNSLLVQSNRDLAEIARILGSDPAPFEIWAESTARALDEQLWDEEHAVYVDFDVKADRRVATRTAAGLAPLFAGVPSRARAERMVELLAGSRVDVGDAGWAVTSLGPADPGLPACALLARAGLADSQLGAPARSRSLRVLDSCRRGSRCDRRAGADAPGSTSTTAPRPAEGRAASSSRGRRPSSSTCCSGTGLRAEPLRRSRGH